MNWWLLLKPPIQIKNMHPKDALNLVIDLYGIKVIDLCERSGINPEQISRYRTGVSKDMKVSTFFKIVHALPVQARWYFLGLCGFESEESEELVAS